MSFFGFNLSYDYNILSLFTPIMLGFPRLLAPSAAPTMVEGLAINATSVRVTWRPPPERQQNGVIAGYRVLFAAEGAGTQRVGSTPPRDASSLTLAGSDWSCVIGGLTAWTAYRVWVLAFTRAGEGPHSDVIVILTDEGGMCPQNFS